MNKKKLAWVGVGILFIFLLGFIPNVIGVDNFTMTVAPGGTSPETFQYTILKDQPPGKYSFTSVQWYHIRFMVISSEGKIINVTTSPAF